MPAEYQCCFCGKGVEPIPPDVSSLLYTSCYGQSRNMQVDQTMWCHTECLIKNLHPSVKLYAVDLLDMRMKPEA